MFLHFKLSFSYRRTFQSSENENCLFSMSFTIHNQNRFSVYIPTLHMYTCMNDRSKHDTIYSHRGSLVFPPSEKLSDISPLPKNLAQVLFLVVSFANVGNLNLLGFFNELGDDSQSTSPNTTHSRNTQHTWTLFACTLHTSLLYTVHYI